MTGAPSARGEGSGGALSFLLGTGLATKRGGKTCVLLLRQAVGCSCRDSVRLANGSGPCLLLFGGSSRLNMSSGSPIATKRRGLVVLTPAVIQNLGLNSRASKTAHTRAGAPVIASYALHDCVPALNHGASVQESSTSQEHSTSASGRQYNHV